MLDKSIDPIDIRFAMLSAHYASTFNFTFDGIASARKARLRIQDYIYGLLNNTTNGTKSVDVPSLRNLVFTELGNDLHTPKALAKLFTFLNDNQVHDLDSSSKSALVEFFKELNDIFDAWNFEEVKIEIPNEIITLAEQRFNAKKEKNFALADNLRNQISELGYIVKDSKDSFTIEKI